MENKQQTIKDVLFPVDLKPIFIEGEENSGLFEGLQGSSFQKVPGFNAVIALDNDQVFSVVAKNYRLISNQEAVKMAKICFNDVFSLIKDKNMVLYNIIMPKTRSFCHIDFVHPEAQSDYFDNDPWTPYLRVTNSYNRMFALNFDLGFCRGICKNGIIFGKKNIEFKFYHSRSSKDPVVEFKLRSGELSTLETQFVATLRNLKRFHVPRKVIWPLACKVFSFHLPPQPTKIQQEIWQKKMNHILDLGRRYFNEMGENGYAAVNVLTDYASRPVGMISPEGNIDSLQRKTGAWAADFVDAIEERDFNFDIYLGKYAKFVA